MTKNKILAVGVLILSIGGAYLINFSGFNNSEGNDLTIDILDSLKKNSPRFGFEASANQLALALPQKNGEAQKESDNLTDWLAETYGQALVITNPSGPQTINGESGITPPDAEKLNSLVAENIKNGITFPTFEEKDIKIIKDNSIEQQKVFLKNWGGLAQKDFKEINKSITEMLGEFVQDKKSGMLERYLADIPKHTQNLLALPVPEKWKDVYLANLNLWNKKIAVYSAIQNYLDDPLKSVIALNEIEKIGEEHYGLELVVNGWIKELND